MGRKYTGIKDPTSRTNGKYTTNLVVTKVNIQLRLSDGGQHQEIHAKLQLKDLCHQCSLAPCFLPQLPSHFHHMQDAMFITCMVNTTLTVAICMSCTEISLHVQSL